MSLEGEVVQRDTHLLSCTTAPALWTAVLDGAKAIFQEARLCRITFYSKYYNGFQPLSLLVKCRCQICIKYATVAVGSG